MNYKFWFIVGTFGALGSVIAGAFGDHLIKPTLEQWYPDGESVNRLANWQTASRYLFYHSLACCIVGLLPTSFSGAAAKVSGTAFVAGMFLFSCCLMAYALSDQKWLVALVPIGGVAFVIGWTVLLVAAIRHRR